MANFVPVEYDPFGSVGENVKSAVKYVESRGNPNAVSPKGAIGTMQTMPGTLRDPGYGVIPARDNSPQELERVGKDYLDAMYRKYGDMDKALAAYNYGPGNVDALIQNDPEGWRNRLPRETKGYISQVNNTAQQAPQTQQAGPKLVPVDDDPFQTIPTGISPTTQTKQTPQGKSFGGFVSNVLNDSIETVKGMARTAHDIGPFAVPIGIPYGLYRTISGDNKTLEGLLSLGKGFAKSTTQSMTDQGVNPADPDVQAFMNLYAPMGESIINPSGVPGRVVDYAYTNPLQTALNLSGGLGVAGKVAEAGNLARTAGVLGKAANYTNPINAAINGPMSIVEKVASPTATKLYESAMKIPPSVDKATRTKVVETGLKGGYTVSESGATKLRSNIDILNKEIDSTIKAGARDGKGVDMQSVVSRIDDLRAYYKDYPRASKYLNELDDIQTQILAENPTKIPLDQAQRMKQRIYQIHRKHYGEMRGVDIEADKAIARGLKEEIVKQYPEIANLNSKDSALIQFEDFLERSVNRSRNYDIVKLGDSVITAGGAVVGGAPGAIAAGVTKHILDSPAFKSRLGILVNKAKRVSPNVGHAGNVLYQTGKATSTGGQ